MAPVFRPLFPAALFIKGANEKILKNAIFALDFFPPLRYNKQALKNPLV
jgi:hypothetical protein